MDTFTDTVLNKNKTTKTTLRNKFKELLNTTSYFNAAEGNYLLHCFAISEHKQEMFNHTAIMLAWGFTRAELAELRKGSLSSESDYLPMSTRIEMNEKERMHE